MDGLLQLIKYCVAAIIRNSFRLIYPFCKTEDKRIVFQCFDGTAYACNPRAIYERLLEDGNSDLKFVWAFQNPEKFADLELNKNTVVCRYRSLKHLYYIATSRVVIENTGKANEMPYRKNQLILQTWHGGGCYKKVSFGEQNKSKVYYWIKRKKAKMDATHFISSSRYFSDVVIREQQLFNGEILKTGMPRNDCLFSVECITRSNIKIRELYNISMDAFVVLYAPTWREQGTQVCDLDFEMIRKVIPKVYRKDAVILYRGHRSGFKRPSDVDVDVTDYYDMQDILCAADMLITDYSSSIWDFSFTGKPSFLYTPDLEEYERYHGFDIPIYEWGFPVCKTNEDLADAILHFNQEDFKAKMKSHHENLGSYEDGHACEKVCNYISAFCEGKM